MGQRPVQYVERARRAVSGRSGVRDRTAGLDLVELHGIRNDDPCAPVGGHPQGGFYGVDWVKGMRTAPADQH